MQNNIINSHTLVFTLSENNPFENSTVSDGVNNFIADFSAVDINTLHSIKNNLTKFEASVSKNKGTFVVVSKYSFDEL